MATSRPLVLITGAAGHLGRLVVERLASAEMRLRMLDIDLSMLEGLPGEHFAQDLAHASDLSAALEGVDGVVHLAALHGIHLGDRSREDFWRTNVDGTFALVEASRRAGVRWLVFASSIGVYGDAQGWLDEERRGDPSDIYQLTKMAGELIIRFASRYEAIRCVSLRLGIFVPARAAEVAARLLVGGLLADDAAEAVVRTAISLDHGSALPPALNVVAPTPFSRTDLAVLASGSREVIEAYLPELSKALDRAGIPEPSVTRIYPTDAIREALGWEPRLDPRGALRSKNLSVPTDQ